MLPEGALSPNWRNLILFVGQGEIKRRPFAYLSLSPDPAAMPVDDPLYYSQADAGAFVFRTAVEALEDAE